jgi:outer membrane protein assembly factor BamA
MILSYKNTIKNGIIRPKIKLIRAQSLYFLFLFCFLAMESRGQNYSLRFTVSDHPEVLRNLNYKKKLSTRTAAEKELNEVIRGLQAQGYLLADTDSILADSLHMLAQIHTGERYLTAKIGLGNTDPGVAARLSINEGLYKNKTLSYEAISKTMEKLLRFYENTGYPFVSVRLDSIQIENQSLSAQLLVQKNKLYKIDSIVVSGDARINPSYLRRYLNIREGMVYNEAVIQAISGKIRQLPFLTEKQLQRVQLSGRINKLILYLDKKNASQFDGIIGLLPDVNTRKTIITGDVKLKLVNGIIRNGETFDLQWRRLQTQTQDFSGHVIYPYLFKSPLGLDYALKIYRRDSTFTDINNNFGLQYYFKGLNNFKVYYRQKSSNLISTYGLAAVTVLPEYADITMQAYGTGVFYEQLDYRFNPRRGFVMNVNAQAGERNIRKNPAINEQVYNALILQSTQYQFEFSGAAYLPLIGQNILKFGLQAASVFGDQMIYRNELFRIGGLKTLRGFDEESIFASTYVIPTLEYRFLFGRNSNLLLFAEGAWYENNSNRQYSQDRPLSLGAGINFDTKAGIFSMSYGVGNQQGNGFDLRNGKIHFGLTALF